jgi:enamine deaminase RidA (YjgF/YER057c/UK114 family)
MGDASLGRAELRRLRRGVLTVVEVSRPPLTELHVSAAPTAGTGAGADAQAAEVYAAIAELLAERGATGVQERVFAQQAARGAIEGARAAALGADLWPATCIEGAPCGHEGIAGVHLYAVAGVECQPVVNAGARCGTLYENAGARHIYLSAPHGAAATGGCATDAALMFCQARSALHGLGVPYTDVVRTWIYLRDILAWYDGFNVVRTAAYTELGMMGPAAVARVPASTGIEGDPGQGFHCAMDAFALNGEGRAAMVIEPLHNPLQNEAYAYGSAFSRGMAVGCAGAETTYISGTASIDGCGVSVHLDDLRAQVVRTLDNIRALIGTRGLTLADIAQACVFVKHGQDADVVREVIAAEGEGLGAGLVIAADVCRAELLFEIDALAVRLT